MTINEILNDIIKYIIIFVLIVLAISVVITILLLIFKNSIYLIVAIITRKKIFNIRMDDNKTLHYFNVKDYDNLEVRSIDFLSDKNKLKGYFYQSNNTSKNALIILSHGLGAGHIQYMEEINFLTKNGYIVFTYDMRGCLNSSGKGIGSFINGVRDLNSAIEYVKNDPDFKDFPILLYGHSLGGFSVNNVLRYQDVKGVVSLSSFNNSQSLFEVVFSGVNGISEKERKRYLNAILFIEKLKFRKMYNISSLDALKNTEVPVLLISGTKDNIVPHKDNFLLYKKELSQKNNIEFLEVENRYHRPNISLSASEYDQEVNKKINEYNLKYEKEKAPEEETRNLFDSFDYKKMVEFDESVNEVILDFYQRCLDK